MDIEKEIEWQEAFKKTYNNSPNGIAKEAFEACDMAIKALKLVNDDSEIDRNKQ